MVLLTTHGVSPLAASQQAAQPQTLPEAPPVKSAQAPNQFFSGTVTAVSAESITVNRRGLGKDSVTRIFAIGAATKTEGHLRVKAKVTVRYVAAENGDRAVHIIVR